MPKFAFNKIKSLPGNKCKILQLSIDGINQLDHFESEMEAEYKSQYNSLMSHLDYYTNTGKIAGGKLKDITPKKSSIKEFEFKTKNGIRLYAAQIDTGKLVVLCGYKGNQKNDIAKFRGILKEMSRLKII